MCKQLITIARVIGCEDVQLIDIGGGFPGESGTDIDKVHTEKMHIFSHISRTEETYAFLSRVSQSFLVARGGRFRLIIIIFFSAR